MQKRTLIAVVLVTLGVAGWWAFRPERLFVNKTVNETLDGVVATDAGAVEPVAIVSGEFHGVSHETRGRAEIYRLASGKRVLRFTGFETSNGPDVQVYLIGAPDANDNETVTRGGFVNVGALKGNIGDQNYELPDDLDLSKYGAVTIWCRRFGVNFATAPLSGSAMMSTAATPAAPLALAAGTFHGNAHETTGRASIYRLDDGSRVLRLSRFETSNGPDVRVYLVAADDVQDNETVKRAGFIDLGAMKGNRGDQNYPIPSDVDLSRYRTVTIWCRRFGVNFGSSPLAPSTTES